MTTQIIERGRGPEIAGTRITVYDIWDYARAGHHHTYIAVILGLSSAQVLTALEYIETHKEEVLPDYEKILERVARGHPPEVQAKVDEIHAKYDTLWEERRKKARENGSAWHHGI
jgi:uncharacterized protein (DUF433 family)